MGHYVKNVGFGGPSFQPPVQQVGGKGGGEGEDGGGKLPGKSRVLGVNDFVHSMPRWSK